MQVVVQRLSLWWNSSSASKQQAGGEGDLDFLDHAATVPSGGAPPNGSACRPYVGESQLFLQQQQKQQRANGSRAAAAATAAAAAAPAAKQPVEQAAAASAPPAAAAGSASRLWQQQPHAASQQPKLPAAPQLSSMPSAAASGPLPAVEHPGLVRPCVLVAAGSSTSLCSSLDEDHGLPAATTGAWPSTGSSRRASLLSDSARASRRCSLATCDSLVSAGSAAVDDPPLPWYGVPLSFGQHHDQNQRTHMEDRLVAQDLSTHPEYSQQVSGFKRAGFFAVFDGHAGDEAAAFLSEALLPALMASPYMPGQPRLALERAVGLAEQQLLDRECRAGSTLLALLVLDDRVYAANVGDCRAVLARGPEPTQITRDHKAQCEDEQARMEAADPHVHVSEDGYVYGELAVSRALGSFHWKSDPARCALTHTPDMFELTLSAEDDFLVLASDGLWDKVSNKEAVSTARRLLAAERSASAAARGLVDRAVRCSSTDNVSVLLVCLHDRPISLPKTNSRLFRKHLAEGSLSDSRSGTPVGSGVATPATNTPRGEAAGLQQARAPGSATQGSGLPPAPSPW